LQEACSKKEKRENTLLHNFLSFSQRTKSVEKNRFDESNLPPREREEGISH
jgi:hypothetical protein